MYTWRKHLDAEYHGLPEAAYTENPALNDTGILSTPPKPATSTNKMLSRGGVSLMIGVGASIGGVEAFRELLTELGKTAAPLEQLAIVYLQLRSSQGPRSLVELLAEATSMNVVQMAGRKRIKRGSIYVVPEYSTVSIGEHYITPLPVEPRSEQSTPVAPSCIDSLFHSLAERHGAQAVGIILSGTGSDGMLGLKAVSDAGGLSFAQTADSARYDSMPRQAAITGVADHVLAPKAMAKELARYISHITDVSRPRKHQQVLERVGAALPQIADTLCKATEHDFRHYKSSTLVRRIMRRMQILKLSDVNEYIELLSTADGEVQSLFRELLIGVTEFFRDPDAFDIIQSTVIPALFSQRSGNDQIRIWVPGCATGQEAYSLAMLCLEHMQSLEDPPQLQVFATDIDERALQVARTGAYPAGIQDEISEKRLEQFFIKRGARYHVIKALREVVLFSPHNLISDPPFSRQDMISCRNLLIYLGPHLQKKLIPLFHYALKPSGYLFLGPSENLSSHKELFRPVDARLRISQRKGTAIASMASLSLRDDADGVGVAQQRTPAATAPAETDIAHMMQRIVLDEFAPKSVVIDQEGHILSASADMQKYLTVAGGNFQNNIIKMARSGLRIGLRAAIKEAGRTRRRTTHENLSVDVGGKAQQVMLTVQPMPQLGTNSELMLVVFHDIGLPFERRGQALEQVAGGNHGNASELLHNHEDADAIISQLERELSATREDLEKAMQDMEATNEELKSSNEELLSMNEELQSANEEMEASKEEIQAGSDALIQINSDLENLLLSTEIATVFLDEELHIRRFTPAIQELYSLIATDIGRPLTQLMPLVDHMPPLPSIEQLRLGERSTHTVRARNGKSFVRRVVPYRTREGDTVGLVVTFTDITQLNDSEAMLRRSLEAADMDAFRMDLKSMEVIRKGSLHPRLALPESGPASELFSRVHIDDRDCLQEAMDTCSSMQPRYHCNYRYLHPEGTIHWLSENGEVHFDDRGRRQFIVGTCRDVTRQTNIELAVAASERQLRTITDALPVLIAYVDCQQRYRFVNAAYASELSQPLEDILGASIRDVLSEQRYSTIKPHLTKALSGETVRYELPLAGMLGSGSDHAADADDEIQRFLDVSYVPDIDDCGTVQGCHVMAMDITDTKRYQQVLKNNEKQSASREAHLRRVIDHQLGLVGVIDTHGVLLEVDNTSLSIAGTTREAVVGQHFAETVFWDHDPDVALRIREAMQQALTGKPVRFDVSLNAGDKGSLMIDFMLAPLMDEQGEVEYLIPSGVDISQRKQAEAALQESENRFRSMVDDLPNLIWLHDVHGMQQSVNKTFCDFFGVNEQSMRDMNWQKLVHPDDVDAYTSEFISCFAERRPFYAQARAKRADGQWRWIESLGKPRLSADGDFLGYLGASTDITDRKLAEQQVSKYSSQVQTRVAQLQALFDVTSIFTGVVSLDGRVKEVNEVAAGDSGYSKDAIEGRVFWQGPWWNNDASVQNRVRTLFEKAAARERCSDELPYWHSDGQRRLLKLTLSPALNESGEIVFVVPSGVDITDQHQFEKSLLDARRAAEVANESKSAFVANMSHEIRTPMSAVLGYADLLAMREQDPEKMEYLDVIKRNGTFLLDIINDILDISKIEAGQINVEPQCFEPHRVIADVLSMMEIRATEKGLDFSVNYVNSIPAHVNSDPRRLKQILVNLLGNAIKFTEKGFVQLRVRFADVPSPVLEFEIIDSGIGISRSMQQQLFQPFVQGDESVNRIFGGTGLGLAISQRLAQLLGGEIHIESTPGEGSCFSFSIAAGDVKDEQRISPEEVLNSRSTAESSDNITLDGLHVLVVDDRRDVRLLVQQILQGAAARVSLAYDGIHALEIVQQVNDLSGHGFDLILLDMQMPRMDGYETATRLRDSGFSGPIVALTADALQADMSLCLQSGCDAYLSKPIDLRALLSTVNAYTRQLRSNSVDTDTEAKSNTGGYPGGQADGSVTADQLRRGLVVDDSRDVCRSLKKLLQLKGLEVECAYSGSTALELARSLSPSVVILDISLPDMSGLDLVFQMRSLPQLAHTRFIALSGHTSAEDRQRSLAAGFDVYLVKPTNIDELMAAIGDE